MPNARFSVVALAALLVAAVACNGFVDPAGPIPTGTWGGPQGNLTVFADSAVLDMPCAAGRIQQPVVATDSGELYADGFFAPMAGPIGIGGLQWQPARYIGVRHDDNLQLTIQRSDEVTIGPLKLHRGVVGQFPRCL